jgi:S-DNA-T family DNA segregation ATPase FtsK/SpoIIIE
VAERGGFDLLTYVDMKAVEGSLWRGVADVATTPDEIRTAVGRLEARMRARLDDMAAKGIVDHKPTAAEPAEIPIVDEGAELTRAGLADGITRLETLAQLGRAAQFWLIWATQYPTDSSGGLPVAIGTQAEATFGLRTETARINRVVFGEGVDSTGWKSHDLPAGGGWFLLRDAKHAQPERARAYLITEDDVRTLPRAEALEDAIPDQALPVAPLPDLPLPTSADAGNGAGNGQRAMGTADLVLVADGPMSGRRIAELIGSNPGTAKRLLDRMAADGIVRSTSDG